MRGRFQSSSERWPAIACGLPAAIVVLACCGLPLLWMGAIIARHPASLLDAWMNGYRARLVLRTLGLNLLAAVIAVVLALPAAFVIGRGRGWIAGFVRIAAPASLLVPLLAFTYGWNQAIRSVEPWLRALGVTFEPGGAADTLRCVWISAAWLSGIPACIVGLYLRRLDPDLQLAASMVGAVRRVTMRMLLGPLVASAAVVFVLASQEFAVYEPSGVGVMATEVRMVFSTGAFSSIATGVGATTLDQAQRAAAALTAGAPLLALTTGLAFLAAWTARRGARAGPPHVGDWPAILDAGFAAKTAAMLAAAMTLGTPLVGLVRILVGRADNLSEMAAEFTEPIFGSLMFFMIVGVVALAVALSATVVRTRGLLWIAVAALLVGGQLLAIAILRLSSYECMAWTRDTCVVPATAYLGRFLCVALAAGGATWGRGWEDLRAQARLCGAGPLRTAVMIVWPLAWPLLVSGAVLVGVLSLTETAATATLIPQHPPVLVTRLLTWAHSSHSARMAEGSLILVAIATILGAALTLLFTLRRRHRGT